jgi:hypothetical protein
MYDMYPWDSANHGDYPPRPLRSLRNSRKTARAKAAAATTTAATTTAATTTAATTTAATTTAATTTAATTTAATARRDFSPAQAVQIALDRRDNGGEAEQAATLPAASQARQ